jgi:hypothetical protein
VPEASRLMPSFQPNHPLGTKPKTVLSILTKKYLRMNSRGKGLELWLTRTWCTCYASTTCRYRNLCRQKDQLDKKDCCRELCSKSEFKICIYIFGTAVCLLWG